MRNVRGARARPKRSKTRRKTPAKANQIAPLTNQIRKLSEDISNLTEHVSGFDSDIRDISVSIAHLKADVEGAQNQMLGVLAIVNTQVGAQVEKLRGLLESLVGNR